jgi:20S proteasome alpha/beta subunit
VPVDDPSKAVKVTRIGENSASTVTGIAPDTHCQYNRIEIRTQYTGSAATFLKAPLSIVSEFVLEEA